MVLTIVHSLCDASIVTLFVHESDDRDRSPTRDNNSTGEDVTEPATNVVYTQAKVKKFLVHENILYDASPVFKAAFQGRFAEAEKKSMTIKDLDVSMLSELLRWLYCGKRLPERPTSESAEQLWYLNMARLAVVADIYQIEGLGDDVIDLLVKGSKALPPQGPVVEFVYANTPAPSDLRRWIVAWHVEKIDFIWYCKEPTDLNLIPEFAIDVAKAFGRQKSRLASKSFFKMSREERKAPIPVPLPKAQ